MNHNSRIEANLLESLWKYHPRGGNDPFENFLTEAFAWILNNYSEFSKFFINFILEKLGLPTTTINEFEWITQYNFDGLYPDMICVTEDITLVFENKAWSPLHEEQIENYRTYAKNNFQNSKIILITATKRQHDQDPDLALCWSDIFDLLDTFINKIEECPFIFKDFQQFLSTAGVGPPAPISYESIKFYYASNLLKRNIGNLIANVENLDWSKGLRGNHSVIVPNRKGSIYGEADGRIGIELMNTWKPGIFVGILIDHQDHCTEPIDRFKGPDFSVIIDFHENLHNIYPSNKNYINFKDTLRDKILKLNEGWIFYHHLDDEKIRRKNYWHPIHVKKPMLDIFAGTTTADEQVDKFYQTGQKIIQLIVEIDSFWKMKDEFYIDVNDKEL